MIHYLRSDNNRTIIECEVTKNDLSASVDIEQYSKILLDYIATGLQTNNTKYNVILTNFKEQIHNLNEIRGWWFEKEEDNDDWKSIDEFVATQFALVATEFNLKYVTD